MIWHNIDQNSDEWFALRMGKFTASTFKDLFAGKTTAAYEKAILRPVFERLTGESPESFSNAYMERGHELEDMARMEYEIETLSEVALGGFCELNEWVGCSPDGFVGDDGLLEIKCHAYNTHINYLMANKLPTIYKWQVHGQMWVTGRKWCDFVSYHPNLPTLIIRVDRDEKLIVELEMVMNESIEKAKEIMAILQNMKK